MPQEVLISPPLSFQSTEAGIEQLPLTHFLEMEDPSHRTLAAKHIVDENVIGLFALQYGAVFSGENEETTFRLLQQVKGVFRETPVAVWIQDPREITETEIVDFNRIHPELHTVFKNDSLLAYRTQGVCMLRFPVKPDAQLNGLPLHPGITSQDEVGPLLQFFYMGLNQPHAQKLIESIYDIGVKITAITSLNIHRQPSPKSHEEALSFCKKQAIPILIADNDSCVSRRSGSYPIITATERGAILERQGNVHPAYLEALGWNLSYPDGTEFPEIKFTPEMKRVFRIIWEEFPSLANLVIRMAAEEKE